MDEDRSQILAFRVRTVQRLIKKMIVHICTIFLTIWFSLFCFNSGGVFPKLPIPFLILLWFNSTTELLILWDKLGYELKEISRLKNNLKSNSKF